MKEILTQWINLYIIQCEIRNEIYRFLSKLEDNILIEDYVCYKQTKKTTYIKIIFNHRSYTYLEF